MPRPALLCHGGVGGDPAEYGPGVEAAATSGWAVLEASGSALAAVVAAVAALEDDPLYNAGTGSYLKLDGSLAMDAAVAVWEPPGLEGEGDEGDEGGVTGPGPLRLGAVAAIEGVRNPIKVAQALLDTPAHLLVGPGATAFARSQGFGPYDPTTEKAYKKQAEMNRKVREGTAPAWAAKWAPWLDLAEAAQPAGQHASRHTKSNAKGPPPPPCETVGAVALDARGRLATASSTGGLSVQLPGRVGDTPLWGAGLYVGPAGAVTATGVGEALIEQLSSFRAYRQLEAGEAPQTAAQAATQAATQAVAKAATHPQATAQATAQTAAYPQTIAEAAVAPFPPTIPVGLLIVDSRGRLGWADNDEGRLPVAARCP